MSHRAGLLANLEVLSPQPAGTAAARPPFAESLGPACHYGMLHYQAVLPAAGASLKISANGQRPRSRLLPCWQSAAHTRWHLRRRALGHAGGAFASSALRFC